MSLRRWVVIGVVGTALAVLSGVVTARAMRSDSPTQAKPEPPLPALYIADGKQDLGEVWESSDAILTVPISNRTDKRIEILDFESSCDCGEISPRRLTVPANGTAEVTVKMDLTRRTPQQVGLVRRKVTLSLRPLTDAGHKAPQLHTTCTSLSALTTDQTSIHFGESNRRLKAPIPRKLHLKVHRDIGNLEAIRKVTCS